MRIFAVGLATVAILAAAPAIARDRLEIVGSTLSFPYVAAVGERLAMAFNLPGPRVTATGSNGGIGQFCTGVGLEYPDIVASARALSRAELDSCRRNGVRNITQIRIGKEALILATPMDSPLQDLTAAQIFAAVAASVPVDGKIVANPHERWNEIDPDLPDSEIMVFVPPASSEKWLVFARQVLNRGCLALPEVAALPPEQRQTVCLLRRPDGHVIEARTHHPKTVDDLSGTEDALAVLSLGVFEENSGRLKPVSLDGEAFSRQATAEGAYQLASYLFVYTKNQHYGQIPGVLEFVDKLTSEDAWGPEGYLSELGLVVLTEDERRAERANAIGLNPMW